MTGFQLPVSGFQPNPGTSACRRGIGNREGRASIENDGKATKGRGTGRQKEHKAGFVVTLDAIAALSFMIIMIYFINAVSFTPTALRGAQLKSYSLDMLTVLEKSGKLGLVVGGDSTALREVLISSPDNDCFQLRILHGNGTEVATIEKPGCTGLGAEQQTAYSTFMHGGELYMTSLKSWYLEAEQ